MLVPVKPIAIAVLLCIPSLAGAAKVTDLVPCPANFSHRVETREGMFRTHMVCDHLLFEVPRALLDRDMLLNTEFAALSTGTEFVAPGALVDNRVVRWIRRSNKLFLETVKYEMTAAHAPGLERGVEAASLRTVLRAFPVLGEGDQGEAIIDVTPLFITDPPKGFALGFRKYFGTDTIDPNRSYFESVKSFPDNVGIRFYQTWVADPKELIKRIDSGDTSTDASLGFLFYTNLLVLPVKPMRPRFSDPRIGYFEITFQDYGTRQHGGVTRGYIQRYRLEKADPAAEVSDPVQPIVFYIGRGVPDRWRGYLKQAVEDWQVVFDKVGFRKAIVARDAPSEQEDPNWDPDDVRYNVIRWTPSGRRNAMGAAVVDPRSGEVISSHTLFWHDVLRLAETWYFTQASPNDPSAQTLPLPDELMGELLRYIARHEVGHALGLKHNFKGSAAVTVKELRDPEWTKRWGTSASTMSYARFNYVAQPGDGAGLLPKYGPYDYFALDWGYRQFGGDLSPDDERGKLDQMAARQVDEPLLRYGGEDELQKIDPTVSENVLGGDPIGAADMGLQNIDRVMSFIVPATTRLGENYDRLNTMYQALVMQRHQELAYVTKLVGGVEEVRNHAGRGGLPFTPVSPVRQRQAVKFLVDRAFTTPTALLNPDVLRRIAPAGGSLPLQGSNVDLLQRLIAQNVFQRMAEASAMAQEGYVGRDLLQDLNTGLFRELDSKTPKIERYRRELQRDYVTVLLTETRTINDPRGESSGIDSTYLDSEHEPAAAKGKQASRDANSVLGNMAQQYRNASGGPTEYRAALRAGVADLYRKIDAALKKVKDPETREHLRTLQALLSQVS